MSTTIRLAAFLTLSASPVFCQTSRPFQLGSGAIQAFQQDTGVIFQNAWPGFSFSQLAPDVDVISVQPEYLGIPYAQFAQGPDLPGYDPWAQQMTALAAAAQQPGKPLMVQIALSRVTLVGNAFYPDGLVQVDPFWAPSCADLTDAKYATLGQSYVNYALWVARTFSPQYLVIMVEPNLYYSNCGGDTPSWELLVKIEQNVYDAVRAAYPSMILFPTFNLEAIYGEDPLGFDEPHYIALQGMKRDRLGFVSFPQYVGNPYQLPIDYYTRIPNRYPSEPRVVITETGWNSSSLDVYVARFQFCAENFSYSEPSFELAFLNFIMYSGYVGNFDLITWWSDRDELPSDVISTCFPTATAPGFLECDGDVWCAAVNSARAFPPPGTPAEFGELVFKAFGSMGLRAYDGTPKDDQLNLWRRFQQLPINSTPAVQNQ